MNLFHLSDIGSENGDKNHDQGDGYESSDLDIDDNEIENLLNENLPDDLKEPKKPKYEERFKTVLEGLRQITFTRQIFKILRLLRIFRERT